MHEPNDVRVAPLGLLEPGLVPLPEPPALPVDPVGPPPVVAAPRPPLPPPRAPARIASDGDVPAPHDPRTLAMCGRPSESVTNCRPGNFVIATIPNGRLPSLSSCSAVRNRPMPMARRISKSFMRGDVVLTSTVSIVVGTRGRRNTTPLVSPTNVRLVSTATYPRKRTR